jgi:hypothetical protein
MPATGRNGKNGRPCGEPACDFRLLSLTCHETGLERECQNLAKGLDLFLNSPDMIGHIPEERLHRGINPRQSRLFKPSAYLHQGDSSVAQAQEVAPELVEASYPPLRGLPRQNGVINLLHLGLDGFDDGHVVVDDEVEDRTEDKVPPSERAFGETSQRSRTGV